MGLEFKASLGEGSKTLVSQTEDLITSLIWPHTMVYLKNGKILTELSRFLPPLKGIKG